MLLNEASVTGKNVNVLQQEQVENLIFHGVFLKPKRKIMEEPEKKRKVLKTNVRSKENVVTWLYLEEVRRI